MWMRLRNERLFITVKLLRTFRFPKMSRLTIPVLSSNINDKDMTMIDQKKRIHDGWKESTVRKNPWMVVVRQKWVQNSSDFFTFASSQRLFLLLSSTCYWFDHQILFYYNMSITYRSPTQFWCSIKTEVDCLILLFSPFSSQIIGSETGIVFLIQAERRLSH